MEKTDVFKLACELGFDVRGAELNNDINSLIIVNENCDKIPGFESNKVIAYNCKKDIIIKRNSVAIHLNEYVTSKAEQEKVVLAKRNKGLNSPIDINLIALECFEKGFIKKDKKKLIKMYF